MKPLGMCMREQFHANDINKPGDSGIYRVRSSEDLDEGKAANVTSRCSSLVNRDR